MHFFRFFMAMGRRRLFLVGTLLLAAAFLVGVQERVVTYVCGNDPMLYQRAARVILQPGVYGSEAWREALTFVAPGYPLLLAGVIGAFGDLAPYWSNLVFLLATVPLMWCVFRRLSGGERPAALMVLCWLWIVFSGHPLHAPFLLYPFREVPRMLLVYGAYCMLLVGVGKVQPWCLIAAAVAMLGACGIREPSVLILPGLLLGMVGLTDSWRKRLVTWCWFLLPWGVVALIAGLVLLQFRLVDISQFSVVRYLGNHDVAWMRARQMFAWFPERMTWLGLVLVGVGIVRSVLRSRVMLGWFLLPACLFFVFYAYMQRHDRYFLTTLVFLAVFAGYGLDWVLFGAEACVKGICRRWQFAYRFVGQAATVVAVVVLVGLLWQTVGNVKVWGPRVRAREVRAWQRFVSALEPSEDGRIRVAGDQRSRYLEDMIFSYTDAEYQDPKAIDAWPEEWAPAHYFRPLNRAAEYATPQWLMYLKVYAHRIMENRMNVVASVEDKQMIGDGIYAHYRLSRWAAGTHDQLLDVMPGVGQVLWFDWGQSPVDAIRQIQLICHESDALLGEYGMSGGGLQGLYISNELTHAGRVRLRVSSEQPLSSAPVVAVVDAGDTFELTLGVDRRLSSNLLLGLRDVGDVEPDVFYWRTQRGLAWVLPVIVSDVPLHVKATLIGQVQAGGQGYVIGQQNGQSVFTRNLGDFTNGLCYEGASGEEIDLVGSASSYPAPGSSVSIHRMGIVVIEQVK